MRQRVRGHLGNKSEFCYLESEWLGFCLERVLASVLGAFDQNIDKGR